MDTPKTPQTYNDSSGIQELKLDKEIQNFLERRNFETYNVTKQFSIENNEDMEWIQISYISFDRSKDESDLHLIDFQQLLSAIASKSKKIVYRIESGEKGINLYLGTLEDEKNKGSNGSFLKDTFDGIYSGSSTAKTEPLFSTMPHSKAMLGIPSLKRDSDKGYKQSLEKILFPLQGKNFRIMLIAESYTTDTIREIISNYQDLGNEIHQLAKQSKNFQKSNSESTGASSTEGLSFSKTEGESQTEGTSDKTTGSKIGSTFVLAVGGIIGGCVAGPAGVALGASLGGTIGGNFFNATKNQSTTSNTSRTNSTNTSTSKSKNTTSTKAIGVTVDEINKSAEYCEKLVDKYIERFQKGLNHGMWNTALYIQSDDKVVLSELEHTLKSVYSGDETYFESIRFSDNFGEHSDIDISKLPMLYFDKSIIHPIHNSFAGFSSAINTEELSILTALPSNDVDGISVSRISSFGLTQSRKKDKFSTIEIGNVLNKKKKTTQRFNLSTDALNLHLFVSGITGSGKSNTIKHILTQLQSDHLEHKIPFLVIEPAKSEYKHLIGKIPNLQVFRPGAKNDIFKFNPFVFEHNRDNVSVTLTKHVDMLKTTFSSAFPMYGPMPYILEDAIHKIYEDKGWNFITEDNPHFTNSSNASYDRKSLLFPNMEDLRDKIEEVVNNSGYAGELDSNIKAALKTRINNLTIGIKGRIFNSRHTFNSQILFEKPTIIELSNISDDDEKSFLMGLLLNKLYQYREEQGQADRLKHITVIEEAHRLLPNISFDKSSEEASSKAKAVETFTNILAEIRAYGEGIIIADQIASKLHPDVIKNTNIKILQRTMDKEDRELVGNAINLTEDQLLDIAELKPGEAIVHNKDIHQAFMVQIDEIQTQKFDELIFQDFTKKFLEHHNEIKYEYLDENKFYIDPMERTPIYDIDKENLKDPITQLLNAILLNDASIIHQEWKSFISILPKQKDKNIYFYLFIKALSQLNFISNIKFYRKIDGYLGMSKSFLRLVNELINENNIDSAVKTVKDSFLHKNIKITYPSMKYYSDYNIDYTLLLLENIVGNSERIEMLNTVMIKEISLESKLDLILIEIFQQTSINLRHSLAAIRAGKYILDFNNICKKGDIS
jgi:DNA helicase HerA-like ATPase